MNSRYSSGTALLLHCLLAISFFLPTHGWSQNLPGSGNSLSLAGTSYLDGGTSNRTITNQVTVEAWVKTTNANYQWIVGKYLDGFSEDKGFQLIMINGQVYCNGRIHVGSYLSSGASTTQVNDGRWHHVAGTSDGNVWRVYVDGVLENSATLGYGQADFTSSIALTVGNYLAQNGYFFQGEIDEVRVWRTVRTAAEVQQNMCRKFAIAPADLVAYYRLDQNSGLTAADAGSQPSTGALMGLAGAPWQLSGAPLGDASASLYSTTTLPASARLGVATTNGDSAVVGGAAARGVQVYAVNSAPTIAAGAGARSSYFGVFTAAGANSASYALRLRPANATCAAAQQRASNDLTWSSLAAAGSTATSQVYGPLTYRGEYILLPGTAGPANANFGYGAPAYCSSAANPTVQMAAGATAGTFSSTPGLVLNPGTGTVNLAGSTPGSYTITNTVASSCATATGTASITIYPTPPTPTITVTGNAATGFTLTSSAATGNQFYVNGNAIPGAINQTYVISPGTPNGSYTVSVVNAFDCTATSAAVSILPTATAPAAGGPALTVYPNPTSDGHLTLELSNYREPVSLRIVNALGQRVYEGTVAGSALSQLQTLNLSALAAGLYILQARTASGDLQMHRIVREQVTYFSNRLSQREATGRNFTPCCFPLALFLLPWPFRQKPGWRMCSPIFDAPIRGCRKYP